MRNTSISFSDYETSYQIIDVFYFNKIYFIICFFVTSCFCLITIEANDSFQKDPHLNKTVESFIKKNSESVVNQKNTLPTTLLNSLSEQEKDVEYLYKEIEKHDKPINRFLKSSNLYDSKYLTGYEESTASSYVQVQPNCYPYLGSSFYPLQQPQLSNLQQVQQLQQPPQIQQFQVQPQIQQLQLQPQIQQLQLQPQIQQLQLQSHVPPLQQHPQIQQLQQQSQVQPIQQLQHFQQFQQLPQPQQQQQQQYPIIIQLPTASSHQISSDDSIYYPNKKTSPYENSISMIPLYCGYIPINTAYQGPAVSNDLNTDNFLQSTQPYYDKTFNIQIPLFNPLHQLLNGYLQNCPSNFYRCNDGNKCIPTYKLCDNIIDCFDASDESNCTCKQRINREKLCDHFIDCPHGEDETGCFGCPENSLSCDDDKPGSCISIEERCDGVANCKNEKDEQNCNTLSESFTCNQNVISIGSHVGFLQRNFQGKWYPVCGSSYSWAQDACTSQLGYISDIPEIQLVMVPDKNKVDRYLVEDGYSSKLISECLHGIPYVRCPLYAGNDHSDQRSSNTGDPCMVGSEHVNATTNSTDSHPIVGIVGGHDSLPRAWPFIIAINEDGHFHCGGTILNQHWILSAAHCFNNFKYHYYDIDAGVLRRYSYSPTRQTRRISGVLINEYYDPLTMRNDIALAMLSEPLIFNSWVRPARLPAVSEYDYYFENQHESLPRSGDTCVAVGWGATKEGGRDYDRLQEVDLAIQPCKHVQDRYRGEICAGYKEGGRDSCQGDSGGPLMCRVSEWNYDWYVGGIVSHGIGCGRRDEPGAYTKVSYFNNWINRVISNRMISENIQPTRSTCPGFICNKSETKCMPAKLRCNGVVDCFGAEDEMNCPSFSISSLLNQIFGRR